MFVSVVGLLEKCDRAIFRGSPGVTVAPPGTPLIAAGEVRPDVVAHRVADDRSQVLAKQASRRDGQPRKKRVCLHEFNESQSYPALIFDREYGREYLSYSIMLGEGGPCRRSSGVGTCRNSRRGGKRRLVVAQQTFVAIRPSGRPPG